MNSKIKLDDFHIIHGTNKCHIIPHKKQFWVQTNGHLLVEMDTGITLGMEFDQYCLDNLKNEVRPFFCEAMTNDYSNRIILSYGMIISMPFLLATFIVYALLSDSNIHSGALMSYVLSLLLGYISLVIVQLTNTHIPSIPCKLLAYSIIYFFIVSYFWMNVMCIDMWLAFRGMKMNNNRKSSGRETFVIYSLYAWGAPTLHVLIVYLMDKFADENSSYHPGINQGICFLKRGLPTFFYFYVPLIFITVINTILFILTGVKIYKAKKEILLLKCPDSRKHSYGDDKHFGAAVKCFEKFDYRFKLYLKLFFAMGINWSTEIISWALESKVPVIIFFVTDCINVLYGVVVFFIFVFKRRTWRSLKKRYYLYIGKPHLAYNWPTTRKTGINTISDRIFSDSTTSSIGVVNTNRHVMVMKNEN
ncbi:hypothetical protein JTB14_011034 [Gonioctena quinquepunctata]|nr:hypothetical protein JTB14_011034 [Gonioctena quinquepunctata]